MNFSNVNNYPVVDRGGLDAAFRGDGSGVQGVYKRVNGGALQAVADNATVMPGGNVIPGVGDQVFKFFDEAGISLANGQMAFWGTGENFLEGIYTDIGGSLEVVVDNMENNTIVLHGQTEQITDISLSHKSLAYTSQGYMVVFKASLQSGGIALIRATISIATSKLSDTIFKSGFE